MSTTLPFSPPGFPSVVTNRRAIDKEGTYLIVGDAGLPQQVMSSVKEAVEAGDQCLLISSRPRTILVESASKIGLDLPRAANANQVALLKSPTRNELAAFGDLGLSRAFRDLIQLAQTQNAERVVMDDFSSFLQFRVFDAFSTVFRNFVRDAAAIETTFVLILGEAENESAKRLLRFIEGEVTRTIYATAEIEQLSPEITSGHDAPSGHSLEADFRAAREAIGLTIEDIQKKTRLATAIIKRFEEGRLIGEPSFKSEYLDAFVKSYAPALGLSRQAVAAALEATRKGTYGGELRRSSREPVSAVADNNCREFPLSSSVEAESAHDMPLEVSFPQVDPLPEAIEWISEPEVHSENAWVGLLGNTVKRLLNRKQVDANVLVGSLFGRSQRATT